MGERCRAPNGAGLCGPPSPSRASADTLAKKARVVEHREAPPTSRSPFELAGRALAFEGGRVAFRCSTAAFLSPGTVLPGGNRRAFWVTPIRAAFAALPSPPRPAIEGSRS